MKTFEVVFFLVLVAKVRCDTTVNTSQLLLPDDSCSIYDTCSVREFFRTCSCRDDCNLYSTCCFDSVKQGTSPESEFECYSERVPQPVHAKRTCSPDFEGEQIVRQSCENASTNVSDLMQNLLVSSSKSRITYWNWNCAICNGENATDLAFWTVQASCPLRSEQRRFDIGFIRRNISYNEELDHWGISDSGRFYNCSLDYYQPSSLMEHLRYCTEDVVTSCRKGWKDNETAKKCRMYYGERRSRSAKTYYRNVHCAICNGVPVSDLECFGRNYMPKFPKASSVTMRVVFNLNPWIGEHTKGQPKCQTRQRFDPFFRICRSVECGLVSPELEGQFCEPPDNGVVSLNPSWPIYLLVLLVSNKLLF